MWISPIVRPKTGGVALGDALDLGETAEGRLARRSEVPMPIDIDIVLQEFREELRRILQNDGAQQDEGSAPGRPVQGVSEGHR
jgi:hypothetical protein